MKVKEMDYFSKFIFKVLYMSDRFIVHQQENLILVLLTVC